MIRKGASGNLRLCWVNDGGDDGFFSIDLIVGHVASRRAGNLPVHVYLNERDKQTVVELTLIRIVALTLGTATRNLFPGQCYVSRVLRWALFWVWVAIMMMRSNL